MSTPAAPGADVESRRRLITDTWAAVWDRGEVDELDSLLSSSYRRRSDGDDEGQDLETFKASIVTTRASFPDLTTHLDAVVVEGDRAAVRWHSTGTHEHPFLGVPATGRTVRVSGATFLHFDADGLVDEEQVTWDPRALLSVLGIIQVGHDA